MNDIGVKLIWLGVVGIAGSVCLLMASDTYPPAVWQWPILLVLGCVLIFIGARNLYAGDEGYGPHTSPGWSESTAEPGRWRREPVVEGLPRSHETFRPRQARPNVSRTAMVTIGLVVAMAAYLCLMVSLKIDSERQEREAAKPERHVLGTLSDRAFAAEDFIMSAAAVPEAEQQLIRKARELVKGEDYQAAIDCLVAPKEKNAWFAARLYYLGCALHHLNRNQEAVDVLSKFIELQDEANAYSIYRRYTRYYRAKALIALDRIPEAVSDLTAAIEIAPAAELHELRAAAHEKLGDADAAQRDRRRAAELNPVSASSQQR
jgi:hypothetical protein